jgi:hypothetical protein
MRAVAWTVAALIGLSSVAAPTLTAFGAEPEKQPEGISPIPARLPTGHPNWTGFWVPLDGMLEVYRGPSGVTGTGIPANVNTVPTARADGAVLKSPYKEQFAETQKKQAQGLIPDMTALCFPPGMPRMMGMIYGMEILQTPNIIAITSEWQSETRRVWLDEKTHPPADEIELTYAGHSIGRWEGDTLVVETRGIREDVPIDRALTPHSPNMLIVERFTQSRPGILTNDMTIIDPELTDTPIKQVRNYRHRPEMRLREFNCLENNRNVDSETGKAVFE